MLGSWVVAGLLMAAPPTCDGDGIRLDWVRASKAQTCPDGADVAARVRRELACDPFSAGPSLRVEVFVEPDAEGWRATMRRLDAAGRVLGETELASRAADCEVLADAVALSIMVVAGPHAQPPGEAETRTSSVAVAPARTSTVVERRVIVVPAPPPPPPPLAPPNASISVAAALAVGTFSGPAPGGTVAMRWRPVELLDLGADLLVLPTRRFDDYGFGLVAVGLAACPQLALEAWTVGACARGYLGNLNTVVYAGAEPLEPGPFLWTAVSASAYARARIGPFLFIAAEVEALVATPRNRFRIDDGTVVHTEAPISLLGRLGVGVFFGE